jgi:hypothetical protein
LETLGEQARDLTEGLAREASEQFRIDARDFLSARERGGTTGTRIDQQTAALSDAAEIVNRSVPTLEPSGRFINAISPVVIPNRQSLFWRLMPVGMMVVFLFVGALVTLGIAGFAGGGLALALFGPHLWLLLVLLAFFSWWRQSVVMVPDGCRASSPGSESWRRSSSRDGSCSSTRGSRSATSSTPRGSTHTTPP